jgi:hypothetical protein
MKNLNLKQSDNSATDPCVGVDALVIRDTPNILRLRLTEADFWTADINYEGFLNRDDARNNWLNNFLNEAGFDLTRDIEIKGNMKFSDYIEFWQTIDV